MNILVTGAASQIGHYLVPMLVAEGHDCVCVSRRAREAAHHHVSWIEDDLRYPKSIFKDSRYDAWINLASIEFVPALLDLAEGAGVRRLIAFSTTSIFTKRVDATPAEKAFIRRVTDAEAEIADYSSRHEMAWTIFRPTMIYSGMDKNITFIATMIRRFGFFPLLGNGKRQPVHAEDLALACVRALTKGVTQYKTYNIGGGEVLTYREMVERVFAQQGRQPRFVRIPLPLLKGGIKLLKVSSRYRYLTTSMIDRTEQDMVYEIDEIEKDIHFTGRKFIVPDRGWVKPSPLAGC